MTIAPPHIVISDKNFANSWAYACRYIMRDGIKIRREDDYDGPLPYTMDADVTIILDKEAVGEVMDGKTHPQFPTKTNSLDAYKREYTYEYVEEHNNLPLEDQFSYLYMDRFINYPTSDGKTIDQLEKLAENIRRHGISRRHQMITWIPEIDLFSQSPPCLQRIQVRPLMSKYELTPVGKKRPLEVELNFRSRDIYGAYPSNEIGILYMLDTYVCQNDFEIVRVIDKSKSGHVYERDWDEANNINYLPEMRR